MTRAMTNLGTVVEVSRRALRISPPEGAPTAAPGDVLAVAAAGPLGRVRDGRLVVLKAIDDNGWVDTERSAMVWPVETTAAIPALAVGDTLFRMEGEEAPVAPAPRPEVVPAPAPAIVGAIGDWRLYFNRAGAAPLCWCVAPAAGSWELAVAGVELAVPARTVYLPKSTPDDEDGRPSAWLHVFGRLVLLPDGRVRIEAS